MADSTTIKLPLKSILRPEYPDAHNRDEVERTHNEIIQHFFERSKTMSKIASIASSFVLYRVNTAIEANNRAYFDQRGEKVVEECFNAVLAPNIENTDKMPVDFRTMVEQQWNAADGIVEWPEKAILGNGFAYFHQQYATNMKTNITTHHKSRLTFYLRMKCHQMNSLVGWRSFDNIDIRNATKAVTKLEDWSDNDEVRRDKMNFLWRAVIELGLPANRTLTKFVYDDRYWFQSIWLFARMQREIEDFLLSDEYDAFNQQWKLFKEDPVNNAQPSLRPPSRIRNFTVVPICRYQLQHVRFDMRDMYNLAGNMKKRPSFINEKTGRKNRMPESYYRNGHESELWDLLFNIEKIHRIGKSKKCFHYQFVTDSVSVSLLFDRIPTDEPDQNDIDASLREMYEEYFENEAGIDPNDKTWMAVTRRHIPTGVEVSKLIIVDFGDFLF